MRSGLAWLWARVTNRLWLRASMFGVGAVIAALLSGWLGPRVPSVLAKSVHLQAVSDLLHIMASSMLVVATFSLASFVTALTVATSSATPRATRILIDDPTSQNALATFIGAFVFSIVGLIGLNLGYYAEDGIVVMMGATILMIAAVIVTLFGWIDYLANLMRVEVMLKQLEKRAEDALRDRLRYPHLGARPADGVRGGVTISSDLTGYVQNIDVGALQAVAAPHGGTLRILRLPGAMVNPIEPLAEVSWDLDAQDRKAILATFKIGEERSFDQDPRFCLSVLSEVASRALSPGINDPGTAIGVIGRLQRLLTLWALEQESPVVPKFSDVTAPALPSSALLEDAYGPLTRDAAGIVEVGLRLQKALVVLAEIDPAKFAERAHILSDRARAQADAELTLDYDRNRLAGVAEGFWDKQPEAAKAAMR